MPEGYGQHHGIRVWMNGVEAPLDPLELQYEDPVVTWVAGEPGTQGGTTLNIHGYDFGPAVAPHHATINGLPCPVTYHSHYLLSCAAPSQTGVLLDLQLFVGERDFTLHNAVSYAGPIVQSASPSLISTEGGQTVTVVGNNLLDLVITSDIVENCTVVSEVGGIYTVACTSLPGVGLNHTSQINVSTQLTSFDLGYHAPSVKSVEEDVVASCSTRMVIKGKNFGPKKINGEDVPIMVSVGDSYNCTDIKHVDDDVHKEIECTPLGHGFDLEVRVWVGGQWNPVDDEALLTFAAPVIEKLDPEVGSRDGGEVTLIGKGFGCIDVGDYSVLVQSKACKNVRWHSDSKITCEYDSGDGGATGAVQLIVAGLASNEDVEFMYERIDCPTHGGKECNDHGTCDYSTGACQCDSNWVENECSRWQASEKTSIAVGVGVGAAGVTGAAIIKVAVLNKKRKAGKA